MSGAGVSMDGGAAFLSSMRDARTQLQDLTQPHSDATSLVAGRAAATAPRVSGALAAGHRTSARPDVGWVYNTEPHAGPIHWGWPARHIKAQPWASMAATSTEQRWVDAYQQHAQRTLDAVKGA